METLNVFTTTKERIGICTISTCKDTLFLYCLTEQETNRFFWWDFEVKYNIYVSWSLEQFLKRLSFPPLFCSFWVLKSFVLLGNLYLQLVNLQWHFWLIYTMTLTLFSSPSQPYISTPPNPCPLLPDLSLSYCSPALLEQSKRWTDEGKTYPETYWKWALRQPDISSLRFFIISVVWCYWHIKESLVILDFCHMLHFCLFTLNSLYYETMLHEHHHNVEFIFSHSIQGCLGKVYVQLCLVSILVDCFFFH